MRHILTKLLIVLLGGVLSLAAVPAYAAHKTHARVPTYAFESNVDTPAGASSSTATSSATALPVSSTTVAVASDTPASTTRATATTTTPSTTNASSRRPVAPKAVATVPVPATPGTTGTDIYALNDRLTPAQTQTFLELAFMLGVLGFFFAEYNTFSLMLAWSTDLLKRTPRPHVQSQSRI